MSWLIDFVKEKEGFRAEAYQDSVGVWTVGYGTTFIKSKPVTSRDAVTPEEGEVLLRHHLQDFLDYVLRYEESYGYDWNNNQVAALTSFIYNLGKGRLKTLTANGKRDNDTIGEKILLYKKAGGRVLKGLEIRRQEESAHFKGE